jgi:F-type H+-transporting ATPase subunit gamma
MNDIKARMKSVTGTMQITKAMELVANSKLRRAKERVEKSRPYYEILRKAIASIEGSGEIDSPFNKKRDTDKSLIIVIAGDRGLAGGYNSNVFKLAERIASSDASFLPIGKKALEYFRHRNKKLFSEGAAITAEVGVGDCLALGEAITSAYLKGEIDTVTVVYTKFVSMMSQLAVYESILPFEEDGNEAEMGDVLIEEETEEMLLKIVPQYIGGVLWSVISEAIASEHGARRSAMNAANKNAEEMLDSLMLKFNRARQAIITQEITEIVSGAEAL